MRFLIPLTCTCTLAILGLAGAQELPTVYQYYTEGGIQSGLTANSRTDGFQLNGRPIRIWSASIHYFRVHPSYWRDRMRKARAAGIIVLDTYIPWNLHEPQRDVYDFGAGGNDMSPFLGLRDYIQMAKEEDLLVILRPGPYICAEWDFGGLPSWLLREPGIAMRASNAAYETRVKLYLEQLIPQFEDLQWSRGGPVIMIQIENEFGAFGTVDIPHLRFIRDTFVENGLTELFFTCDSPIAGGDKGAIYGPGEPVLQAANFFTRPKAQLDQLLVYQPDKPIFIAEYWSGWFDHVLDPFHWSTTVQMFTNVMRTVLVDYDGSINFYMFHGGTSFGFLAGANSIPAATGLEPLLPYYAPDISSYDYNAPLSESGDYTEKYWVIYNITQEFPPAPVPLFRPHVPDEAPKIAYPHIEPQLYLTLDDLLDQIPSELVTTSTEPTSMEMLPINGNSGQSYGYILYRMKEQVVGNRNTIKIGKVRDMATLLVDGERQNRPLENIGNILTDWGYWVKRSQTFTLSMEPPQPQPHTVDILVENMGRVNFGGPLDYLYQKGLQEGGAGVEINGRRVTEFQIYPLEFKSEWLEGLTGWRAYSRPHAHKGPVLVQGTFEIADEPRDTFLDMSHWHKGVVFVNGFNMGRYFKGGPATTTYVAAPFLRRGTNTITIFEQYTPSEVIVFRDTPNLGKTLYDFLIPAPTPSTTTAATTTTTMVTTTSTTTTQAPGGAGIQASGPVHVVFAVILLLAFHGFV